MSNVNDLAEISQPLLPAHWGAHIHFNRSADGKRSTQIKASARWTEILQETELLKRLAVLVKSSDYDRPRHPKAARLSATADGHWPHGLLSVVDFFLHLHHHYCFLSR
jgi:hypothetical protein